MKSFMEVMKTAEQFNKQSEGEHTITMKRAITGELGRFFDSIVFEGNFIEHINSYDKIRKLIRLFFFDHERKLMWLEKIDEAEEEGIKLWENKKWVNKFRNTLILEYGVKIQETNDTFVIIADMLPYHRRKELELYEPINWEEVIKE